MNFGIYWIKCLINDKVYIGSTINFKKREYDHKSNLRCNKHCNQHLQNAWNRYGKDNFIFEKLEYCSEKNLLKREQFYLDNFIIWGFDYNICRNAGNTLGFKMLEEDIKKYSRENHYCSKFFEEDIKNIRDQYMIGVSQNQLAKKYKVSRSTIQSIVKNINWYDKHYDPKQKRNKKNQSGENNPSAKLNVSEVKKIRELYKTKKYTYKELAKKYGVHFTTIYLIIKNKKWINAAVV